MKEKVCVNCKHGAIGISPSVGGFNAGVYCHSKAMAGELDEQTHGDTEAVKEFEQVGFLHLFRIECMDEDRECPCFESRTSDAVTSEVC